MKQNKNTFIFDNFAETQGAGPLDKLTALLNAAGVTYCVEPWGDGLNRVYVRKDVAHILSTLEEEANGANNGTTSIGVPEQS